MPHLPLDPTAPCLILAPHLIYPTRNGSDISLDRIGQHLSVHLPYVDLIGASEVVRFEGGQEVHRLRFRNRMRSKVGAAIFTLLRNTHFYLEKFVTPAFAKVAYTYLKDPAYKTVLCSYITTADLIGRASDQPQGRCYMIWSHNDEFKWFQDLQRSARHALERRVAGLSESWLHHFFRHHQHRFLFLHVTEADQEGYAYHYKEHASCIIPIGVDLEPSTPQPLQPPIHPVRLIFVGSLGVRMNLDALHHFSEHYFPPLRAHFADNLQVLVAGSQPSPAVRDLCRVHGWALHADVSSETLHQLWKTATFSLLPFGYATGAKLKLLGSLAHGIPFLATTKVGAQTAACFPPSLMADDPQAWVAHVDATCAQGIPAATRQALMAYAQQHSWSASVEKLIAATTHHPTKSH